MATIMFERLVGRDISRFVSSELDLSGLKMNVNEFLGIALVGGIVITVIGAVAAVVSIHIPPLLAFVVGLVGGIIFEVMLYGLLELMIDGRKEFVEKILPDYLQLTSANMRSGVSLSRAMTLSVRPDFKYFGDDINMMGRQLYSGDTMQNAFKRLAAKYRSVTLNRTTRVILESEQYGGGLADLLNQIAKDLRGQRMVQKEVSGQLFMYTIFIAFAALVGAPTLYGLTNQMIGVTTKVWSQINIGNLGATPSVGASFIKLSKPQITPTSYYYFSLVAIVIITGFGAFIISAISSGSALKGIKFLPVFIIAGIAIFFIVSAVMNTVFSSFGTA